MVKTKHKARVVQFKPEAVVGSFAPIPELVEELTKLLEEAKSGKLRAAAYALVYHEDGKPDGTVSHGWTRGPYTAFAVTEAIELLSWRWKKEHFG